MASVSRTAARIYALAGTNGAGKSSVVGEVARERGADYFNPDEAARRLRLLQPWLSQTEANGLAWQMGKRLLEAAIAEHSTFAFETTLGGNTIPRLLQHATSTGIEVVIWYVGLSSPELHIARVRSRVQAGGHDIPEERIRERYARSQVNLIQLMPELAELIVYDNSAEADPTTDKTPEPVVILHMEKRTIIRTCDLKSPPLWAKPILAAALRQSSG